jgi:hypothetical protein
MAMPGRVAVMAPGVNSPVRISTGSAAFSHHAGVRMVLIWALSLVSSRAATPPAARGDDRHESVVNEREFKRAISWRGDGGPRHRQIRCSTS